MALNQSKAWTLLGPTMEDYLDYEKANISFFTTATDLTTLTASAAAGQPVIKVADPQLLALGQTIVLPGPVNVIVNSIDRSTGDVTLSANLAGPHASGSVVKSTPPRRRSYGESANSGSGVVDQWLSTVQTITSGSTIIGQNGEAGRYSAGRVEVSTKAVTGTLTVNVETSIDGTVWNPAIAAPLSIAAPGVTTGAAGVITTLDQLIRFRAVMSGGAGDKAEFKAKLYLEE